MTDSIVHSAGSNGSQKDSPIRFTAGIETALPSWGFESWQATPAAFGDNAVGDHVSSFAVGVVLTAREQPTLSNHAKGAIAVRTAPLTVKPFFYCLVERLALS